MLSLLATFSTLVLGAVIQQSTFDLEFAAKTDAEKAYHDFIVPLMQGMLADRNLTSLRATHPLLNPGSGSRANGIIFEFESMKAWSGFQQSFSLHLLSLAAFWKNFHHTLWQVTPTTGTGPFKARSGDESTFYYILNFDFTLRDAAIATYNAKYGELYNNVIAAMKDQGLVEARSFADFGHHSSATRRMSFEFDSFAGVAALMEDNSWKAFIAGGTAPSGYFASWSTDVVVAPGPISVDSLKAQAAAGDAVVQDAN